MAPKAAQLKELAAKLPPPGSVKETPVPATLDPPLVFHYKRGKNDTRPSPSGPNTVDFVPVELLADPAGKPSCGMSEGTLARCINWVSPTSPFVGVHADKRDGLTEQCLPMADVRYVVVTRVLTCGEAKVTGEGKYAASGIRYEAFLADLASGTVLGQFAGHASPPETVKVYAGSASDVNTVDRVQGATRQAVHDDLVRRLNAIPGSRLE
jgi:hypothetical protein